jgi:hypothetical protein
VPPDPYPKCPGAGTHRCRRHDPRRASSQRPHRRRQSTVDPAPRPHKAPPRTRRRRPVHGPGHFRRPRPLPHPGLVHPTDPLTRPAPADTPFASTEMPVSTIATTMDSRGLDASPVVDPEGFASASSPPSDCTGGAPWALRAGALLPPGVRLGGSVRASASAALPGLGRPRQTRGRSVHSHDHRSLPARRRGDASTNRPVSPLTPAAAVATRPVCRGRTAPGPTRRGGRGPPPPPQLWIGPRR